MFEYLQVAKRYYAESLPNISIPNESRPNVYTMITTIDMSLLLTGTCHYFWKYIIICKPIKPANCKGRHRHCRGHSSENMVIT